MKKIVCLFIFLFCYSAYSQSLSLFSIDASNFPIMKAKFYALDAAGKQITNLSPSDFSIKENGIPMIVKAVSCPNPKPTSAISSVLVFDMSLSMDWGSPRIQSAKDAANAWVDGLPADKFECALVSFADQSYIVHDFTTDKQVLKSSINQFTTTNGTNYNQALLDPPCGGLQIAKKGKYKRVVIFLTDGEPNFVPKTSEIIQFAKQNAITIYAVTMDMHAPQCIKDMTAQTGGEYFENITTINDTKDIYTKLLDLAQSVEPCEITWQSEYSCQSATNYVEIKIPLLNLTVNTSYHIPTNNLTSLEFTPVTLIFKNIAKGTKSTSPLKVTARNSDYDVLNITSSNPEYDINPKSFSLKKDQSQNLSISYTPTDSIYSYTNFKFETDRCQDSYYASGIYSKYTQNPRTIKLTHPNGGEVFVIGSDTVISWEGISANDTVCLEYSIDNGATWKTITYSATGLKYIWKDIPPPASNKCLVKVRHMENNFSTLYPIFTLQGHNQRVNCVSWNPDGSKLASGSDDNDVKIWDTNTGSELLTLSSHIYPVNSVCWNPDGSKLASGSDDKTILLWKTSNGFEQGMLKGHTWWVYSVAWSPDGKKIASASSDATVRIWDPNTKDEICMLGAHRGYATSVAWSPDGSKLVSTSWDRTIKLWDINTGFEIYTINAHMNDVLSVSWSPDGTKFVSVSKDKTIKIWDVNNGNEVLTITEKNNWNNCVSWNPDGRILATAGEDSTIKLWDSNSGELIRTIRGHTNKVLGVSWSLVGNKLASSSEDSTIKIWQIEQSSLQEDQSDSVFSIVMPSAASNDIDMKKCLVWSVKDSVINAFISNTGAFNCRIDSIYFEGGDNTAFSLVSGLPKYNIPVGGSHWAEISFKPSRVGLHSSKVKIKTQAETLTYNIVGEGVLPVVEVVNKIIDFGKMYLGEFKDTLNAITIKNIGKAPLVIISTKHNLPNDKDFTTIAGGGSFTMQPGETHKMDLKFKPSDFGRTMGTLEFYHDGIGSPEKVILYSECIKRAPQINAEMNQINDLVCDTQNRTDLKITNTGEEDLVISTIDIVGKDKADFSAIVALPTSVLIAETITIPIVFTSYTAGTKEAELVIYSNAGKTSEIRIPLQAKKFIRGSKISNTQIDLQYVYINYSKKSTFIIENNGNLSSVIKLIPSAKIQLSETDFTLQPNESKEIEFTYLGSSTLGLFGEEVTVVETTCTNSTKISIYGTIVDAAYGMIKIPATEGKVNETINIPIIVTSAQYLQAAGVKSISAEMSFNSSMLYPVGKQAQKIDATTSSIFIDNIPVELNARKEVPFIVALGNAEMSDLKLFNVQAVGGPGTITSENGTFKTLGICREGGTRLFNPTGKVEIMQIIPNPASEDIEIKVNLIEEGTTSLSIFNSNGLKVKEFNITSETGIQTIRLDGRDFSNGLYFIQLQTPTVVANQKLMIIK